MSVEICSVTNAPHVENPIDFTAETDDGHWYTFTAEDKNGYVELTLESASVRSDEDENKFVEDTSFSLPLSQRIKDAFEEYFDKHYDEDVQFDSNL